jgi:hypothetical protein
LKVVGLGGKSIQRVEVETEGKILQKSFNFNYQLVNNNIGKYKFTQDQSTKAQWGIELLFL